MTRHAWSVVLGAAALAIGLWCYFNFEAVDARKYVGYSGEAARNPLLALQRLSERMGAETQVVRRATDLDSAEGGGTLVLSANRHGMTPTRTVRLLQWVKDGGRLVVEAEPVETRDALLDTLGIRRGEARAAGPDVQITLPHTRSMKVAMQPVLLTDRLNRPGIKVAHGAGTALLQIEHGRGSATVLPSFAFMKNSEIGKADHAAFAWALLHLGAANGGNLSRVLIAPRFERPSLLAWLAGDALPAVAGAGVLLALWLVRKARRFGPVVPQDHAERRRLLDHLRASGRFQWSAHAAPRLLAAAREGCLANIAKARPALAGFEPAERSARFAELTGLPQSDIEFALAGDASNARAFVTAVQTLQVIEEKLARRASA